MVAWLVRILGNINFTQSIGHVKATRFMLIGLVFDLLHPTRFLNLNENNFHKFNWLSLFLSSIIPTT